MPIPLSSGGRWCGATPPDPLLIFSREGDGERLVTAANASGEPRAVTLSWSGSAPRDLLSGEVLPCSGGSVQLTLPPWGCRLLLG